MKTGITASTFDLLHSGHIAMLREAKSQCDYLICALQVDPSRDRSEKNAPIQSLVERQAQLSAVKYVDEIMVYETEADLEDLLAMCQIDIKIMGEEYRDIGKDICKKRGIELYFNKRDHRFSSSELRHRICHEALSKEEEVYLDKRLSL